jgi:aspartyl/asparaginyl beta-hydroxylase (cupin superfamily)
MSRGKKRWRRYTSVVPFLRVERRTNTFYKILSRSGSDCMSDREETAWLAMALAEPRLATREAALSQFLDEHPHSIGGHIAKGDSRAEAGDVPAACLAYNKALRLADGRRLPHELEAEVRRAALALRQLQDHAGQQRERRLDERGLPPANWTPRFRHAMDLAAGRRRLYLQEPTAFTYPGLPHIQFYDPSLFSWAAGVEAASDLIKAELQELKSQNASEFRAYIKTDQGSGPLGGNKALINNDDWSILPLCENGWLSPKMIERCPHTWRAILEAPIPRISGWGPTVVFSMLKAGARIAPHTGMFNTRLICHLPLIVPTGCRFRVGNEVREWEEGKLMIFDDTIEHEAWNEGPDDRIVLIFDIWRPELTDQERYELTALFSD